MSIPDSWCISWKYGQLYINAIYSGIKLEISDVIFIQYHYDRSIHPQDYEEAETRSIRRKQLASDDPGKEMQAISQQFADWWDQAQNLNFALVWSAIATTFTLSNIRDAIR